MWEFKSCPPPKQPSCMSGSQVVDNFQTSSTGMWSLVCLPTKCNPASPWCPESKAAAFFHGLTFPQDFMVPIQDNTCNLKMSCQQRIKPTFEAIRGDIHAYISVSMYPYQYPYARISVRTHTHTCTLSEEYSLCFGKCPTAFSFCIWFHNNSSSWNCKE